MFQRLFIWPLFAALMGFAIGGSVFWALYGPNMPIQDISKSAENHATEHEAKSKREETDEALAYYTLWLMVFTGVLAFATVGLGVATVGLYFTGEKQIKIGMRASMRQFRQTRQSLALTKRSADAAIKIELPVLRAWPGQTVYKDKPTEDGVGVGGGIHGHANFPRYSNLNYIAFSNDGRTAATPKSLSLGYHEGLELPAVPHYRRIMHFPEHVIIRNKVGSDSDSEWQAETYLAINLTEEEHTILKSETGSIWLFCSLRFLDFMGEAHENCFCWKWQRMAPGANHARFERVTGLSETYNRKT